MAAFTADIILEQGTDFSKTVEITSPGGAVDLTGATFLGQWRSDVDGPILQPFVFNLINVPAKNEFAFSLSAAQLSDGPTLSSLVRLRDSGPGSFPYSIGVYDVEVILNSSVTMLLRGKATFIFAATHG